MITPSTLNKMFMIAIFIAALKLNKLVVMLIKLLKGDKKMENITTVPMLNARLKWASFLASFSAFAMP